MVKVEHCTFHRAAFVISPGGSLSELLSYGLAPVNSYAQVADYLVADSLDAPF